MYYYHQTDAMCGMQSSAVLYVVIIDAHCMGLKGGGRAPTPFFLPCSADAALPNYSVMFKSDLELGLAIIHVSTGF